MSKNQQLTSFIYFRAIAIILIVFGHTHYLVNLNTDNNVEITILNLIAGGTSLFVFISGFMFHHVFYQKFNYKKFISKKIKNVLIPYIVLGFIPVVIFVIKESSIFNGYFLSTGENSFENFFIPALKYYWTGVFLTVYWYIPFIMLIFLMSYMHIIFIKFNNFIKIIIIIILSILSLLIHRPIGNILVLQNIVYFTPIYLLGIFISQNKEFIYRKLKNTEFIFLIFAIALSYYQATTGHIGNFVKDPLIFNGLDLMYLQKILLCFFFLLFLHRFENMRTNIIIEIIAITSFTIFFLHGFFIYVVEKINIPFINNSNSWIINILILIFIIYASVKIALLVKKIIPNYSRFIIGY